jgi:uncharacterized membrane protein
MRHITSTFFRGLSVLLPVVFTVWIVYWLAKGAEQLLRPLFNFVLPPELYQPGLGIVVGVVLVYVVGVLVQLFVVRRVWLAIERLFERIPLVKSVYSAISDFFEFFTQSASAEAQAVVSVALGPGASLIGFVTDSAPTAIDVSGESRVAVYMPMSYQIGGYTLLVDKSRVTPLNIGVEEAMRLVLTAAIQRR